MNTRADYSRNLADALASEGSQAIFSGAEIEVIRLPSGGVIAWRPPESADPSESSNEIHKAAGAVRAVTNAAARVASIQRDADLSDTAKARKVAEVLADAATKAERAVADAEAEIASFEAAERQFMAPPTVADPVEQIRDMEARQWLAAQPVADLAGVVQKMQAGELPDVLAAAMRSPVPLPGGIAQALPAAWRAHLERTAPDRLQTFEQRRERVEWLRIVVRQAADAIPRQTATGPVVRKVA
jgi:hypothetical protein